MDGFRSRKRLILEDRARELLSGARVEARDRPVDRPRGCPATGEGNVAVVSWSYWRPRLHRDPAVLGKRIFYNDAPKTIIGVAPRKYFGAARGLSDRHLDSGGQKRFHHAGAVEAGRDAAAGAGGNRRAVPSLADRAQRPAMKIRRAANRMELLPAGAGLARVRDQYGKPLVLLMAVVGAAVAAGMHQHGQHAAGAIGGAATGTGRACRARRGPRPAGEPDADRIAASFRRRHGGRRGGGVLRGRRIWCGSWRVAARLSTSRFEVQPDLNLVLFTAGIALFTGLLFGLAPAWYAFRVAPASALRQTGRGGDTWFWRLFGKGLVAAQVALSIFLVTAAAVFLSHLTRLRNFDLGFRSDHVLLVTLDPRTADTSPSNWPRPTRNCWRAWRPFRRCARPRSAAALRCKGAGPEAAT